MVTMFRKTLVGMVLLGPAMSVALAMGGIDWSGFGRVYYQDWNFENKNGDVERTREKIDFRLMGSKALGDNITANFRFKHYSHDFHDRELPFGLDRAYLQWNYGEKGNFVSVGKLGKMYKFVGDHLRGMPIGLFGATWMHNMPFGDWNVFLGASYFRLDDAHDDEDDADYMMPQIGIEMDGPIRVMVGATYHLYGDTDEDNETTGDTVDQMAGNLGDTAGLEFFGRVSGMMGDIGWRLMASHYTNGDAPDTAEEDTATLYGVGLSWMDFAVSWEMQTTGDHSVNTALTDDDWCGLIPAYEGANMTCEGMRIMLKYKMNDNVMPSFTMIQSEWNDDNETEFNMMRVALNFMF